MAEDAQNIWDDFLICIDDPEDTKYETETAKLKLMNLATRDVLNRLLRNGISVSDGQEDISFTAGTQEVKILLSYNKLLYAKKYITSSSSADTDLIDDILYPIINEELAKKSQKPCFYFKVGDPDKSAPVYYYDYLGYYRVPSENFKIRLYYARRSHDTNIWLGLTASWGLGSLAGFEEGHLRNCIVYKMAELTSISDTEQRSVWENKYEAEILNILDVHENRMIQKEVVDVY